MNCALCGKSLPAANEGRYVYALCVECIDKPSRRRLTQAGWEAELARATDVQAKIDDGEQPWVRLRTRTGRRQSWWQRGWKR